MLGGLHYRIKWPEPETGRILSSGTCSVFVWISNNNRTHFFQTGADRYDLELKVSYPHRSLASQVSYLGAFAYWRKATVRFVMFVWVSLCLATYICSAPTGRVFGILDVGSFHENLWEKSEILVKSDKNIRHLREYLSNNNNNYYYYYCWRRQIALNALLRATCR